MGRVMNLKRLRSMKRAENRKGPVVYWMQRDQRVNENWALIYASLKAREWQVPLLVVFSLVEHYLGSPFRHYHFMIMGLKETQQQLNSLNIPFYLLKGNPEQTIPRFMEEAQGGLLITDFNPLRIKKDWEESIVEKIKTSFFQVDAHNIVPCWTASPKQEYAAYTFRPKIKKNLPEFLETFPEVSKQKSGDFKQESVDWDSLLQGEVVDASIQPVDWLEPGYGAGMEVLEDFIREKLPLYANQKNDPNAGAVSDLSPYLHFGQISAQEAALRISQSNHTEAKKAFLEELIVRRELSDNFCFYNPHYDNLKGIPQWAKETLEEHRSDNREHGYSPGVFEQGKTHEDLWNAAQMELVKTGKMHGYMRMYWAKKILEWSETPEEALKTGIYLNDKYSLDGRDPNGYAGLMWSMGGVHDRPWPEREIFGKIRYMNRNGARRKFDVKKYIDQWI
jgi:deoxyribodipyrimidine photo-lyase